MSDPVETTQPKSGFKTSELALSVAAAILTALFASGVIPTEGPYATVAGIAATVLTALGYTVARTVIKRAAVLWLVVVALGGTSQLACAEVRPRAGAAVAAFLDCEAAGLPADTLADATSLASSAARAAISGSGRVDTSKIRSDVSGLKTDLLKCAYAAAVAALLAPTAPQPGAPAAAPLEVDAAALRSAFSAARVGTDWPVVRTASGTVL